MQRWQHLLGEIRSSSQPNSAIFAVAIRELQELAQAR
jgi:glutamate dehydrogenase